MKIDISRRNPFLKRVRAINMTLSVDHFVMSPLSIIAHTKGICLGESYSLNSGNLSNDKLQGLMSESLLEDIIEEPVMMFSSKVDSDHPVRDDLLTLWFSINELTAYPGRLFKSCVTIDGKRGGRDVYSSIFGTKESMMCTSFIKHAKTHFLPEDSFEEISLFHAQRDRYNLQYPNFLEYSIEHKALSRLLLAENDNGGEYKKSFPIKFNEQGNIFFIQNSHIETLLTARRVFESSLIKVYDFSLKMSPLEQISKGYCYTSSGQIVNVK